MEETIFQKYPHLNSILCDAEYIDITWGLDETEAQEIHIVFSLPELRNEIKDIILKIHKLQLELEQIKAAYANEVHYRYEADVKIDQLTKKLNDLNKLSDSDKKKFEQHLLDCDHCFEKAESFQKEVRLISSDSEVLETFDKAVKNK